MKKTAIQELINELNEEVSKLEPNQYSWHCLMTIIEMAESKLKKEKQDLMDAYDKGIKDICTKDGLFNGIKFYLETFEA